MAIYFGRPIWLHPSSGTYTLLLYGVSYVSDAGGWFVAGVRKPVPRILLDKVHFLIEKHSPTRRNKKPSWETKEGKFWTQCCHGIPVVIKHFQKFRRLPGLHYQAICIYLKGLGARPYYSSGLQHRCLAVVVGIIRPGSLAHC